ncbi:MAG: hypothetical protein HeimC2_37460 [Candidatus Heimdallarchaeota archaeon LC_2]|nr:MAG: hypothetical protein HeimC2_37460 [Candidatus Heimdallarchaeota archaeon LC_2]
MAKSCTTASKFKQSNFAHFGLMAGLFFLLFFLPTLGVPDTYTYILFFIGMMSMHLMHGGSHGEDHASHNGTQSENQRGHTKQTPASHKLK